MRYNQTNVASAVNTGQILTINENRSFSMANSDRNIIPDRVKEALAYNPETGHLTWISRPSKCVRIGAIAAAWNGRYLRVRIFGVSYMCHRLAWFLHYGEQPPVILDHIDGDKRNNRIDNLRAANESENQYNSGRRSAASGFKNVTWIASRNKWQVQMMVNKRTKHIGFYADVESAANAAREARALYHGEFANHG